MILAVSGARHTHGGAPEPCGGCCRLADLATCELPRVLGSHNPGTASEEKRLDPGGSRNWRCARGRRMGRDEADLQTVSSASWRRRRSCSATMAGSTQHAQRRGRSASGVAGERDDGDEVERCSASGIRRWPDSGAQPDMGSAERYMPTQAAARRRTCAGSPSAAAQPTGASAAAPRRLAHGAPDRVAVLHSVPSAPAPPSRQARASA